MAWLKSLFGLFGSRRGKPSGARIGGRARRLEIAELEPRLLLTGVHLDFGSSTSPVASGYVGVPVAGYGSSTGYGWIDPQLDSGGRSRHGNGGKRATFMPGRTELSKSICPMARTWSRPRWAI